MYGALTIVLATLVYTAWFSFGTNARYMNDTRVQAAHGMARYTGEPLRVSIIWGGAYSTFVRDKDNLVFRIHPEGRVGYVLERRPFEVLRITSLHYLRWLRHGKIEQYQNMYGRVREGNTDLVLVKDFEAHYPQKWFYSKLDPMYACLFVSPTIEFYAEPKTKQQLVPFTID